jgi:hypothetical protein
MIDMVGADQKAEAIIMGKTFTISDDEILKLIKYYGRLEDFSKKSMTDPSYDKKYCEKLANQYHENKKNLECFYDGLQKVSEIISGGENDK